MISLVIHTKRVINLRRIQAFPTLTMVIKEPSVGATFQL